jgi:ABC-type lipoprotein release transport system permease subunit
MKTLFTLSWRNIWRHPGRSGALLAAVIAGLWAGALTVGAMNGMLKQRLDYLINNEISHVQIHHPQFLTDAYPRNFIPDSGQIKTWLEQDERIRDFSFRTLADGMLQSPVKTSGVRIRGIDTTTEPRTTRFHENLVSGNYLDNQIRNPVIMGQRLAQNHNVDIGQRIVLVFETVDNELTAAAFNIVGLFASASEHYDKSNVFVRTEDLSSLLADQPVFHEVAMMLHEADDAGAVAADLNTAFSDSRAQTWFELSPELQTLVDYGKVMLLIITIVIMLALAFGIINTMLMAIFERLHEIGMLISVGMSRLRVLVMILLEALILTLVGAVAGILLAGISVAWLHERGINLELFAAGLAEIGYDNIIYPFLEPGEFVTIVLVVIVVTLLASAYPAIKAIRINPLEATKGK